MTRPESPIGPETPAGGPRTILHTPPRPATRTSDRSTPLYGPTFGPWLTNPDPAVRLISAGDETYTLTNLAAPPTTPLANAQTEKTAIARIAAVPALAGLHAGAVRSLIRGTAHPSSELDRLNTEALGVSTVVDGVIVTTDSRLLVHCLLAFEQPRNRSKGQRLKVPDPRFGHLPDGTTHIDFDDATHMRDVQRDVLARTLPGALEQRRHIEILETGVRRNIVVELAYVTFADSTRPQWILNIRDGISRWSTMLAATLGLIPGEAFTPAPNPARRTTPPHDDTPGSMARHIADTVCPCEVLARAKSSKALVTAGLDRHKALVADYTANTSHDTADNAWALVLRQCATVPSTVILRAIDRQGAPTSIRRSAESLVADLHTGVDTWDDDDRKLFDAKRALRAAWAEGHLSDDEATLWLGLRPMSDVDVVFPPPQAADADRAGIRFLTLFYARLLRPDFYDILKGHLHSRLKGRYSFARMVEVLAPLANQHWDSDKPLSRLWAYQGGPVVEEATRRQTLDLRRPADYRTLVPLAEGGDTHARAELVLAGGSALVNDAVITTTLIGGSGSATTRLPYRGSSREIFTLLATTETGLTTLAHAANNFDPGRPPAQARHCKADLAVADGIARDPAGVPTRLFEHDIAALLASTRVAGRNPQHDAPSVPDPRAHDEADLVRHLDALPGLVADVERHALESLDLYRRSGANDIGLTETAAEAMADRLTRASTTIARLIR